MSPVAKEMAGKTGEEVKEDVWIHSSCEMCYGNCGTLVHRVNGVVVKIEGDPNCPHNNGKTCAKGQAALMTLYDPNRVKTPLRRTNPEKGVGVDPKWERISWDEALNIITEKLKKIRADDARKLLVATWDSNVGYDFILRPWMSAYGAPGPVLTAAYRCGAALHSVSYLTNGTFHNEIDADHCNYVILFGNQMGFMVGHTPNIITQKFADARARGMKLVVVDPMCSNAAAKANEWIPIRPGTDAAMALAMLNVLLNELGLYDKYFLKKHTNAPYLVGPDGRYLRDKESQKPMMLDNADGKAKPFDTPIQDPILEGSYVTEGGITAHTAFYLLKEGVKKYTPESVEPITTVPAATIRRLAKEFGEAAKIGSKIIIDGEELPYRPAAANFYRGVTARKHGSMGGLSVQLLNLVIGNLHVPGGHTGVNLVGPAGAWGPDQEPDGLMVPPRKVALDYNPYNFEPHKPGSVGFVGLLPIAHSSGTTATLSMLDPQKYQQPVQPEMLIQCRVNLMMSRENVKSSADSIKTIPFIVSFACQLDEMAEFADIVLPDTHALERLVLFPNREFTAMNTITGYWYWGIMQPVVKPMGEARHWWEVLVELVDRVGFREEFNRLLNASLFKAPYKVELDSKCNLEEIMDRKAKLTCGPEHGLDWFKKNGYLVFKRKPDERYPLLTLKSRLPIYFENYVRAGEIAEKGMGKLGVKWDVTDYRGVPDWKPSPAMEHQSKEFDMYCINYKTPLSFQSFTAQNAWLNELLEQHQYFYRILLNTEAAKKRKINDGDLIWVESPVGKVKGRVKVTECIHPEAVGIAGTFGAWSRGKPIARGKGVHHNALLPLDMERIDGVSGAVDDCVEVKVYKAEV